MTDPLANHTSFASMLASTKVDPLPPVAKPKGRWGIVAAGAGAMLGALVFVGTRNDKHKERLDSMLEKGNSRER